MTTLLPDALAYADRKLRVIALHSITTEGDCTCREGQHCGSIGKHPRWDAELLPNGARSATTNPDVIRRWWDRWPTANLGIATGSASGVLVLDVDGETGAASLRTLEAKHGPLPRTTEAVTGSGGRHILFAYPGHHSSNTAGLLAPGLDIRCCGGLIVAAPSPHVSGHCYQWEVMHHPDDVTPAPAPGWLLELLKPAPRPKSPLVAAAAGSRHPAPDVLLARALGKVGDGEGRDNTGLWLACQMRDAGYSQAEAEAVVIEYVDYVPEHYKKGRLDPYDEADAKRNARSAYSRPARPPWSAPAVGQHRNNGPQTDAGEVPLPVAPSAPEPDDAPLTGYAPGEFHLTDMGNAQRLVARHGENIRYAPHFKRYLFWAGSHWQRDAAGEVEKMGKETVRSIYDESKALYNEAVALAKSSSGSLLDSEGDPAKKKKALADQLWTWAHRSEGKERLRAMIELARTEDGIPVWPHEMDADAWRFNCLNGTVDLRTGVLHPHRREDLNTIVAPVEYDPDAGHPVWDRFLTEAIPDVALRGFVQKAAGASLVGVQQDDRVLLLVGPGGSGKTTFMEACRAVMGEYGAQSSLDTFTKAKRDRSSADPGVARLRGKRAVFVPEAGQGSGGMVEFLKAATGGDTVAARDLFESEFEFKPVFTPWFRSNSRPKLPDDDSGLLRRVLELPFTQKFAKPDEQLRQTLTTDPAALVAVFAWMVQGCILWQQDGLRNPPEAVVNATNEFWQEMDPLAEFVEECCVTAQNCQAGAGELYSTYAKWAKGRGMNDRKIMSIQKFGKRMGEKYPKEPDRTGTIYRGIGIRSVTAE
jgi:putative DNA primase/helicase